MSAVKPTFRGKRSLRSPRVGTLYLSPPSPLVQILGRFRFRSVRHLDIVHHSPSPRRLRHPGGRSLVLHHGRGSLPMRDPALYMHRKSVFANFGLCQLGPNRSLKLLVLLSGDARGCPGIQFGRRRLWLSRHHTCADQGHQKYSNHIGIVAGRNGYSHRNRKLTIPCYTLSFAMGTDQLQLEARDGQTRGQRVLALTGVLTISTLFVFQEFAHSDQSEALIVDMTGVPYIDSAGLGSIISAYVSREREARKLALAGVNDRVKMVMTVTGVEELFQMYPSVTDAEQALGLA